MVNQHELAEWFRGEFRRLLRADGERSGPCIVVDAPAAPPAPHGRETLWGELKYAPSVPMRPPACLCSFDTEAGRARRASVVFDRNFWVRR